MTNPWTDKLPRTAQCKACPWIKGSDPYAIPRGYDVENHKALAGTIADPDNVLSTLGKPLRIFGCHDEHEAPCVGWLHNQLGDGNNIALRLALRNCSNVHKLRLRGEQHPTFNDTLPQEAR